MSGGVDILLFLEDDLSHFGTKFHSGRYPYGSGENPYQHSIDFFGRYSELRKSGLTDQQIADSMGLSREELKEKKSQARIDIQKSNIERAQAIKDNPQDFYDEYKSYLDQGMTKAEIAKKMDMSTSQLIQRVGVVSKEIRKQNVAKVSEYLEQGYSKADISRMMGVNESTIRSWLNMKSNENMNTPGAVADIFKTSLETDGGFIDIGKSVELELGISKEKFGQAISMLEDEGYPVYAFRVEQPTNPGKFTTMKVVCPKGTEYSEVFDTSKMRSLKPYSSLEDDSNDIDPEHPKKFVYPESMDSSRLMINYAEDGGVKKDGLIEIRPGVADLDLGGSNYAQVRILVDGNRYLKGMAAYADDLPDGVDVRFNTNKSKDVPKMDVLKDTAKHLKTDPTNPFGALIKENGQSYWYDEDGKQHLSLINKKSEEGDWGEWSKKLPSQFLAKQNKDLIQKQLDIAIQDKNQEFKDIMELNNPAVKKKMLESFAEDCDKAAEHLQAAALPRQKYQVILPLTSIRDDQVYAPGYDNGEKVALVRFPHGGTFEIPILTVNNKLPEGQNLLGKDPKDAIGISSKVAERLSGADFDGDTVLVIPTNKKTHITSTDELEGLKGFDAKKVYGTTEATIINKKGKEETIYISNATGKKIDVMNNTQNEMGRISNLIMDMDIMGASPDEKARAVRHSQTVIDAEKHKLDYKKSYIDNGIAELKAKYQGRYDENGNYTTSAATLLTRAGAEVSVPHRKEGKTVIDPETGKKRRLYFDPETGKKLYTETGQQWEETTKSGKTKTVVRTQRSSQMNETDDPYSLVSKANTYAERAYANYASEMKRLANEARKETFKVESFKRDPEAVKRYSQEVGHLESQLKLAQLNKPKERMAVAITDSKIKAIKTDNKDISKKELKKLKQKIMAESRLKVGAKRYPIDISDKEWEAIQNHAISYSKLTEILKFVDEARLKELATPRPSNELSESKINLIKSRRAAGYSVREIAKSLGVSASTVENYLE